MNIYSVGSDYENYRFLLPVDDECGVVDTDGSSLIQGWQSVDYFLFKDPRRKNDKRRIDFIASCYHPGVLIIDGNYRNLIVELAKVKVEFLEISTPELPRKFYIANIIESIHAIDDEGLSSEQFMSLFRAGEMKFNSEIINDKKIFRDKKYNNLYFCTPQFVDEISRANITGLKFNVKGTAP